ncbi:RagB/SusD family nutrient uptake outer membrane protein [Capnocytophaga sp.]|uniref:RagB/SusD family nutrient uptake outer membrane protein n=1 Tax=Capnocytophaga sp. TaxID=44737 RepID=UPI0026DB39CA|nr:RagB/SusD family nutrient uptake outer membrane protein [Capnocytophaga sp.]MDO5105784.1 RagB/SusD family nutrient uptake outer membrane protein [Capnocytophaga sp.]
MKKFSTYKIWGLVAAFALSGCLKDLNQDPSIDPDSITSSSVETNPEYAKQALAKVYASLALTGQQGPTGTADIQGLDEGTTQFTRLLFYMQELPTDNAIVAWSDPGVPDFHNLNWSSSNGIIEAMYYRLAQSVSFANAFIANNEKSSNEEMRKYGVAEARFIRAYAYYHLMDLFGNVPVLTQVQDNLTGQNTRKEVFEFIESELKAIENDLKPAKSNEYGRVDVAAAWALLSRLYLNAEVYTGTERYADCVTYSEKVIASGYALHNNYVHLFLADNDTNGAQNENIFTANFDGVNSQTWAGSTFLVHGAIGGKMSLTDFGVSGGAWAGIRSTKALVEKFAGTGNPPTAWTDKRAMFFTDGQKYEITNVSDFKEGYAVMKFKNLTSAGQPGKDPGGMFVDTDIALIRLGEIYLNYAEAAVRKGVNQAKALEYVNALRTRSGASALTTLTAENVLDERARELYWEGFRRTDLIRYGLFTSSTYLWPFKGGVASGAGVDAYRTLYPIPTNIILSSKGVLKQNAGY